MNRITLIGRLTADPEIRVTQSGKKVASIRMAVNDGKSKDGTELVQYFNLTAWEKLAEIFESYVKKGHRVAVNGRLQNRTWDKPDGTKGYATDVVVIDMEMLTSRAEAQTINSQEAAGGGEAAKPAAKPPEEKLPEIDVDSLNVDMPF